MEISFLTDNTITTPFSLQSSLSSPLITSAIAPPRRRRTLVLRRRRTRRKSDPGDFSDGGGFFGGGGGWSSGGGGGGGSFGWGNWEWDSEAADDDPAFDFVYGVMCWVALSNCLCFAFKKVARIGGGDERDKIRLAPIC